MFSSMIISGEIQRRCQLYESDLLSRLDAILESTRYELRIEKIYLSEAMLICLEENIQTIKKKISTKLAPFIFDAHLDSIDLSEVGNIFSEGVGDYKLFKQELVQRHKQLQEFFLRYFPLEKFTSAAIGSACTFLQEENYLVRYLLGEVSSDKIIWAMEYSALQEMIDRFNQDDMPDFMRRSNCIKQLQKLQQLVMESKESAISEDERVGMKRRIGLFDVESELRLLRLIKSILEIDLKVNESKYKIERDLLHHSDLLTVIRRSVTFSVKADWVYSDLIDSLKKLDEGYHHFSSEESLFAVMLKQHVMPLELCKQGLSDQKQLLGN